MTGIAGNTDVLADISVLVGEMPGLPCEGKTHGASPNHGDGEATHYAQTAHQCAGPGRPYLAVYPVCAKFAAFLQKDRGVLCTTCGQRFPVRKDWIRVLGPVGG